MHTFKIYATDSTMAGEPWFRARHAVVNEFTYEDQDHGLSVRIKWLNDNKINYYFHWRCLFSTDHREWYTKLQYFVTFFNDNDAVLFKLNFVDAKKKGVSPEPPTFFSNKMQITPT